MDLYKLGMCTLKLAGRAARKAYLRGELSDEGLSKYLNEFRGGKSIQTGRRVLGEGQEGRVYDAFTPGKGRTVSKVYKHPTEEEFQKAFQKIWTEQRAAGLRPGAPSEAPFLGERDITYDILKNKRLPVPSADVYGQHGRGFFMEKLNPVHYFDVSPLSGRVRSMPAHMSIIDPKDKNQVRRVFDLHSDNIMEDDQGNKKVVDFGHLPSNVLTKKERRGLPATSKVLREGVPFAESKPVYPTGVSPKPSPPASSKALAPTKPPHMSNLFSKGLLDSLKELSTVKPLTSGPMPFSNPSRWT